MLDQAKPLRNRFDPFVHRYPDADCNRNHGHFNLIDFALTEKRAHDLTTTDDPDIAFRGRAQLSREQCCVVDHTSFQLCQWIFDGLVRQHDRPHLAVRPRTIVFDELVSLSTHDQDVYARHEVVEPVILIMERIEKTDTTVRIGDESV